jgi:hypothetical protein
MTNFARGMDWGSYVSWNGDIQFNWPDLVTKGGIQWASFKGAQNYPEQGYSTTKNMVEARKYLEIVGCYYWHDPTAAPAYLLDIYSKSIELEKPDFIDVDIEQNLDYLGNKIDPNKIADTAQQLCEGLLARYPEKRIEIYTRKDFILSYAPKILNWGYKFGGSWWASWPDYGMATYRLTWDQIKNNWTKQYPTGNLVQIVDGWNPLQPAGWQIWSRWQYSSRILLPVGTAPKDDHQNDFNLFNGDIAAMKVWAKMTTPVEPPVDPTMAQLDARVTNIENYLLTLPHFATIA